MPSAKVHDTIGVIGAGIASTALAYNGMVEESILLGIGTLIGTFYFSPDLDVDIESKPYKRWGLLKWLWYPYKEFVKHRSWLSHSGPLSATIRILYFLSIMIVLLLPVFMNAPIIAQDLWFWANIYSLQLFWIWLGFTFADILHTTADLAT